MILEKDERKRVLRTSNTINGNVEWKWKVEKICRKYHICSQSVLQNYQTIKSNKRRKFRILSILHLLPKIYQPAGYQSV